VPQPSCAMPGGLKRLFRLAEQPLGALGVQNRLLVDLATSTDHQGEMRAFGKKNQGGFFGAVLWTLDDPETDPTVWFREYVEPPDAELTEGLLAGARHGTHPLLRHPGHVLYTLGEDKFSARVGAALSWHRWPTLTSSGVASTADQTWARVGSRRFVVACQTPPGPLP
jgi:hypothetical protein